MECQEYVKKTDKVVMFNIILTNEKLHLTPYLPKISTNIESIKGNSIHSSYIELLPIPDSTMAEIST